jgi:hypothetical protein
VAAVSSLTLTAVAVLGFMPGGSALAGLPSGTQGLLSPGAVEAIPVTTPHTQRSTRPSVPGGSFTIGGTGTGRLIGPSGGSVRPSPSGTRSSAPTPAVPTPSSSRGRTPVVPPPIIVPIGGLSETQASSARQMVVNAVNSSLSAVMKPRQLLSVQATLTPAVDLAVRSAVSSAANDALNAATAATADNASPDEVSAVTTQVFRSSLAPALAATVPVAVSTTLTTAGVVTARSAPVVDALVTVAASSASDDVADVTTPTVVEQVTTVITTPGATPTTPVLTPTPTSSTSTAPTDTTSPTPSTSTSTGTEPTDSTAPDADATTEPSPDAGSEQPTGTPESPDADAAPTDEADPSTSAAPSESSAFVTTGPTTGPALVPTLAPTATTTPQAVSSVVTSHALVAALAAPTPLSPHAGQSTSDLFRISPHLIVRVTTSSPRSAHRTTTMIVPTVPASAQVRSDRASATGQQARGLRVTHAPKPSVSRTSTPTRRTTTSATARSTRSSGATTSASTGLPTATLTGTSTGGASAALAGVASDVPDGFSRWSTKKQWRWLRASGQKLSYRQWKDAVRQAASTVDAGATASTGGQRSGARYAPGRHRR